MRSLNEKEEAEIKKTISPLLENRKAEAVIVYGSQIAGYATEGSDYDVIVVLSRFSQRIKYYYLKGKVECSVLAVDSRSFASDCSKSSLGEFVSGRLLNPYECLWNESFIQENDLLYKRRVILEGLEIGSAEIGSFAEEMEFGIEYFLFEKLRRRVAIYPPVAYSYAQTYGEKLFTANSSVALQAFRKAARQLDSEGQLRFLETTDKIKIRPERFKGKLSAKIGVTASYATRGLKQYAVHGYAGRVGFDIVGREVVSKLSRSKGRSALPECIQSPRGFWSLPDTKLILESSNWMIDLQDLFGMKDKSTKIAKMGLGELYSSAKFFTLSQGERSISFAAKQYNDVKGMKWGLLNIWSLRNTNFTISALERLHREYRAIVNLRKLGLLTPEVLAVFLSERLLVTRYISGRNLSKLQSDYLNGRLTDISPIAEFGKSLAILHRNDFCLGDSKPSNVIISNVDESVYLTDLEQAHEKGNPVWDVAEFIYYSVRFTLKEEKARKLVSAFVQGYLEGGGSKEVIRHSAGLRYRAPFQPFIAPNVLSSVLRDLSQN